MRSAIVAILFAGLFFASSVFAADSSCNTFAHTMTDRAVAIFHDKGKTIEQKREALYALFYEAVDTDWMGKFVLGHYWQNATPAQRKQYLEAYRTYVGHSYISKLDEDDLRDIDAIQIVALMPRPDGEFEAKTLVKQKDEEDASVHFLLSNNSGKCRVHDIKIEGVSLLTNQYSEFSALTKTAGVQGVIAALQRLQNNQDGN